jgi:hypothetical protein
MFASANAVSAAFQASGVGAAASPLGKKIAKLPDSGMAVDHRADFNVGVVLALFDGVKPAHHISRLWTVFQFRQSARHIRQLLFQAHCVPPRC